MKTFKIFNDRITNIIVWMLLVGSMVLGRDTLYSSIIFGFEKSYIMILMLYAVVIVLFVMSNVKYLKAIFLQDQRIKLMGVILVVFLLSIILKRDFQPYYLNIYISFCFPIMFSFISTFADFKKKFIYLMVIICSLSIFTTYILPVILNALGMNAPILLNSSQTPFFNYIIGFKVTWPTYLRNFSFFREPAVFIVFIFLALLQLTKETFKKKGLKTAIHILFIITILSTFSTTGLLCLGIYLSYSLFKLVYDNNIIQVIKLNLKLIAMITITGAVMIILLLQSSSFYWQMSTMFSKLADFGVSLYARVDSIVANSVLFFQSPLYGNSISAVSTAKMDNIATLINYWSVFGVVAGVFTAYIWHLYIYELSINSKKVLMCASYISFWLIIFITFNSANVVTSVFALIFPMYALLEKLSIGSQGIK